jgi:2,3-dihydroxy-2,3-dihydro-p-cumate dehydrogenase
LVGDLSREYGPSGLTFNVLAPLVQSSGFERLKSEQPRLANRVLSGLPMGRPAELAEVVAAVDYLTSREARLVNGLALGADAEWQPL